MLGSYLFYLNRSQPIEKSRFGKINASKLLVNLLAFKRAFMGVYLRLLVGGLAPWLSKPAIMRSCATPVPAPSGERRRQA